MGSIGPTPSRAEKIDFSHHINTKSKARHSSPLKDIIKFMGVDGMISLAGGLPHPSLFPVQQAKFDCLAPGAPLPDYDNDTAGTSEDDNDNGNDILRLTLGRGSKNPGDLDLTQLLQYETVHSPPCPYEVLLHPGNTNAWAKIVGFLCEDNDYVLVEEYTYPSAQALWIPLGIRAVPVCADQEGISADVLRGVLEGWDECARRSRRPRVLYLVSVGSNPTGITISRERGREYETTLYTPLTNRTNIVLVEDDPYYFLQYPAYNHNHNHNHSPSPEQRTSTTLATPTTVSQFLKTLTPSFLSMDTQGRVIRLESFSKTLFPGLRLGYFIANPQFTERLLRATEVETQDPAGLSQAFVLGLLNKWGVNGYLVWLQRLQGENRRRRDWLVRAFYECFTVLPAGESPVPKAEGLVACLRDCTGDLKPVFSLIDPTAGMFIWAKFYFSHVPRFQQLQAQGDSSFNDPEQTFATEL
ncbi:pyridoxal phosphate-dependent transferase [Aspergillus undulatus]|uniref:pyridoxal phosphate-dependent transferase n=1 Tax=Aspergillus undulatus TaxID=1810928 RepID=UPI003CCE369F